MSRDPFKIKEFDIVTSNPDYKDYYAFMEKGVFDEFDEFVRKNTPAEETEENGALDFFKAFSKKGVGDVIQAKNYVGLIELASGAQIQILPKIDFVNEDEPDKNTERVFLDMLRSMKDFPGKSYNTAGLKTENMNLYEIFIKMYITEVTELVKRGLKSAYVTVEDNERFYKGKLLVNEHIKWNIAHKERFYVSYDSFEANRPENRLIKSTLLKLQKISVHSENLKNIRQLLSYFELIDASTNIDKDFSKVVIDRNTKEYEEIMVWSKVFLKNKSFSTFSGDTNARALLFPMEKVFESYVARKMAYEYSEFGWNVSPQDESFYLFTEKKKGIFRLKPDIVLDTGKRKYIMDTKWKRLSYSYNNYGISQADMYQMFAYSKKYGTPYVWLLYPATYEMKDQDIRFESIIATENSRDKTIVKIQFINIANIGESLEDIKKQIDIFESEG